MKDTAKIAIAFVLGMVAMNFAGAQPPANVPAEVPLYAYAGDGRKGAVTKATGVQYEDGIVQATDYHCPQGTTLTTNGRAIYIFATSSTTIDCTIDVRGKGGQGGAGNAEGEPGLGLGGRPGNSNGGGGSGIPEQSHQVRFMGGDIDYQTSYGAGGGGGGGPNCGQAATSHGGGGGGNLFHEGGRGGQATQPQNGGGTPGKGGSGGGLVVLVAPTITINAAGIIDARGQDGVPGTGNCAGGGGGSGGVVVILAGTYTNSGTISVTGGLGGASAYGQGGAGGTAGQPGAPGGTMAGGGGAGGLVIRRAG